MEELCSFLRRQYKEDEEEEEEEEEIGSEKTRGKREQNENDGKTTTKMKNVLEDLFNRKIRC